MGKRMMEDLADIDAMDEEDDLNAMDGAIVVEGAA